jgi:hypothetical protein
MVKDNVILALIMKLHKITTQLISEYLWGPSQIGHKSWSGKFPQEISGVTFQLDPEQWSNNDSAEV